ncbi:hypothetical protein TIFTF001_013569 [Ficus carica]|uniref:Uncharacterized protein n=1 Tax=Ficus carica TaxID=3494 RepID=A0AA88D4S1_FICCA|nr:hypothetical protein TIFTF001_013569 [Ficus carica]
MENHKNNLFLEIIQEPKPRCALFGPTHERDQKWQTNQFNHSDQQTLHYSQTSPHFLPQSNSHHQLRFHLIFANKRNRFLYLRPYCARPQSIWHPLPTNDFTSISSPWPGQQSNRNIPRQMANHNRGIKLAIQIKLNLGHLPIPRWDSKTV